MATKTKIGTLQVPSFKFVDTKVIQNEMINVNQIAFDRPTDAMLSFLKKHFNLNNPIKQHNHFVIFDKFFHN